MKWLKFKLKEWLGINDQQIQIDTLFALYKDLVSIGVDVHFKEPHMILIFSKLKGGQIRHIEASFDDMRSLNSFVKYLRNKFNTNKTTYDLPYSGRRNYYL